MPGTVLMTDEYLSKEQAEHGLEGDEWKRI
jgi:hypothetical protein